MIGDFSSLPASVTRAADRIQARLAGQDGATIFIADVSADSDLIGEEVDKAPISILVGSPPMTDEAFIDRLRDLGVTPEFTGHTRVETPISGVAVLRGAAPPLLPPAPCTFRAVAVLAVYNEADIIRTTIEHLVAQGLEIYLIDNWSTDDTLEIAQDAAGAALLGSERFPLNGPSPTYDWAALLSRVELIAADLETDWIVANDADEIRVSPWPALPLRDALWHVQERGYNAVNYSTLNFALTAPMNGVSLDLDHQFPFFDPQRVPDLGQLNTWRRFPGVPVDIVSNGRHRVSFEGRLVFPYNFLLKHYPIRSLEQGLRKINHDRLPRYRTDERLRQWHSHYRRIRAPQDLLADPATLLRFDAHFNDRFLLERLTGVGFEPAPTTVTAKVRAARLLRRVGLLDPLRRLKWRLTP